MVVPFGNETAAVLGNCWLASLKINRLGLGNSPIIDGQIEANAWRGESPWIGAVFTYV
mgnify:CR=1 FL=1